MQAATTARARFANLLHSRFTGKHTQVNHVRIGHQPGTAAALGVPVTKFFGTEQEQQQVIFQRAHEGVLVPITRGLWEGRGGERFVGRVEPFVLTLDVGADSGFTLMVHTGHEFVFRLAGTIEYEVEEHSDILNPEESLLFAAHLVHRWRNAGKVSANLLIVLSGFEPNDQRVVWKSCTSRLAEAMAGFIPRGCYCYWGIHF